MIGEVYTLYTAAQVESILHSRLLKLRLLSLVSAILPIRKFYFVREGVNDNK